MDNKNTKKRRMFGSIFLFMGFISIGYFCFSLSISAVMDFGILFYLILGIFLIIVGYVKRFTNWNFEKYRTIKKIINAFIAVILISFVFIEGMIIYSGNKVDTVKGDYMLILGAGLKGEELSLTLYERLISAIEYLNNNPNMKAIVSGGKGFGESISEAEAMKKFLIEQGISAERIIKEERATSTFENIKYSKEIIDKDGTEKPVKLTIVTSDFHIFRAKFLARRQGIIPYGIPSHTPLYVIPNCYAREYFAVIKSIIFDW